MREYGANAPAPRPVYDGVSRALHWLLAGLVLVLAPLGFWLRGLPFPSAAYDSVHMWHRSLGEVAFLAAAASLAWRRRRSPVAPVADPAWRLAAARWAHRALLALLIAAPLVKLMRGAFGIGWAFFGLRLAAPWPPNPPISRLLTDLHAWAVYALLALAGLHTGVALWRSLVDGDATLSRMGVRGNGQARP